MPLVQHPSMTDFEEALHIGYRKLSPTHNQRDLQLKLCNTHRMQIYNGWVAPQLQWLKRSPSLGNGWDSKCNSSPRPQHGSTMV